MAATRTPNEIVKPCGSRIVADQFLDISRLACISNAANLKDDPQLC